MHSPLQQELQLSDQAHKHYCRTLVSIPATYHKTKYISSTILQPTEIALYNNSESQLI